MLQKGRKGAGRDRGREGTVADFQGAWQAGHTTRYQPPLEEEAGTPGRAGFVPEQAGCRMGRARAASVALQLLPLRSAALTDGSQARPSPTLRTNKPLPSPGKGLRVAAPLGSSPKQPRDVPRMDPHLGPARRG